MNAKRVFLLAVLLCCCCGSYATEAAAVPIPLTKCGNITVSGSYILTKNIIATSTCFVIQADNVTIDLGGYTISSNGMGDAITDNEIERRNVAVRNGIITNNFRGIKLFHTSEVTVERVHVVQNANHGIMGGAGSIIRDNVASHNGGVGIFVRARCLVSGNVVRNNSNDGIQVDNVSIVIGNIVTDNGGFGVDVTCPINIIGNVIKVNDGGSYSGSMGCSYHQNID